MLLIFGGHGQLGQCFQHYWPAGAGDIIALDITDCDITNANAVAETINKHNPTAVINCAAYTDVNKAESDDTCFVINGNAVKILAEETAKRSIPLIHFSTDFVFNGETNRPYITTDKTNPINAYGQSKLQGEEHFLKYAECGALIRISHLSSPFGNNIVKTFKKLLTSLDEISVVADQTISITFGRDVVAFVDALLQNETIKNDTAIYHLGCANPMTFFDMANEMKKYLQSDTIINPTDLDSFSKEVKRPAYTVFDLTNTIPLYTCSTWQDGLSHLMKELER